LRGSSRIGKAGDHHAPVLRHSIACHPALALEALDEQRHRGLGDPLELGELGDPARPFAQDAHDLELRARELSPPHLLDEEPDEDRGARGQVFCDVIDLLRPLCAAGSGRHIANYIVI